MRADRAEGEVEECFVGKATIKRLSTDLLSEIAARARDNPRLRKNYNLHELSERVQRFINVMQPGTYVRPHCHHRSADVNGFELFVVLHGEVGIVVMNDRGEILQRDRISASGPTCGIELPEGTYHTLVALVPDTTLLEVKEGPYNPQTDKDFLSNFPQEGTPAARHQEEEWRAGFT
ncbi:MAG: WbuC family cupin fold metalloprotein [Cyanobacteria bacterium J06642_2]